MSPLNLTTCPPATGKPPGIESGLAEVLADIVHVEQVPADSHFFDDLGADSMVMARFCARVRKRTDLPPVSMQDIYAHPTIRSLAAALAEPAAAPAGPPAGSAAPAPREVAAPAGTPRYVLCGALQFLFFLGYAFLGGLVIARGYEWIAAASGPVDVYLRSVLFGGLSFLGMCTLPILAKWTLIGRWKPRQLRIWSLLYVRFWLVKTLVRANPLVLFAGSPLYVLYLRALGAKIGRGVAIFSRHVPVCTDLLTIGEGTVIRKDSFFSCYRAHAGLIQTGPVTLGKNVTVSEATVLDIDTSLGDEAQLGHRSALHAGQAVPAGQRRHGSPAQRTDVDYRMVGPAGCGTRRRAVYTVLQVLNLLLLGVPLAIGGLALLLVVFPEIDALLGAAPPAFTSSAFYRDAVEISFVLFFGATLAGIILAVTVPRLLNLAITPDKVYRLYGFHYSLHRIITRLTNQKFLTTLFGDSSYIVHYLSGLGHDLSPVVQTGSNFGTTVKHETPYLSSVGSGTMIADGLSIINADFSSTSFHVSRASIGAHNFLGNGIAYPSQGRTGDNCLLASKVMVPIDGKVRENVGLLGSPSFEIPRSVERDATFDHLKSEQELGSRLAAKNRYNLRTIGVLLGVRWMNFLGIALIALTGADLHNHIGTWAVTAAAILIVAFTITYGMFIERAAMKFGALRPRFCSIYEPYFWWHERYWKLLTQPNVLAIFNGTPFKGLIWRLLGVRIGRRLFDDGCDIPERTLVTIGDDCTLNTATWLQSHSQEDGAFKSDHITIGSGCTIGAGAWVHYGVTMSDGAVLAPDSFLMKGEEVPPHAHWGGNPAREIAVDRSAEPVTTTAAPPRSVSPAVAMVRAGEVR